MPLKLIPPRPGKTPFWSVRGTHLGVYVDRSTKTPERAAAEKQRNAWKADIQRGAYARKGAKTFLDAAVDYMGATGNERFLEPVLEAIGAMALSNVDQEAIDELALRLYPTASPATRNRQVHTPVSAILKHAGRKMALERPKGWRGSRRTDWMTTEQAFRLLSAASSTDAEFGIFLTLLLYTGLRLGEALGLTCERVQLGEAYAFVPTTKNDDPRGVFLPPVVVAALGNLPRGLERLGQRVFRFRKSGRLYALMARAKKAAGADLSFVTFHIFRHTWATWMRRYAGLDTTGLVATRAWRDRSSAARYEHTSVSEEAKKAELLPVENPWKRATGGGK